MFTATDIQPQETVLANTKVAINDDNNSFVNILCSLVWISQKKRLCHNPGLCNYGSDCDRQRVLQLLMELWQV